MKFEELEDLFKHIKSLWKKASFLGFQTLKNTDYVVYFYTRESKYKFRVYYYWKKNKLPVVDSVRIICRSKNYTQILYELIEKEFEKRLVTEEI